MLSRTASSLYWMSRYVERAENTARVLDVTYRMSLVQRDPAIAEHEWYAPLNITGTLFPFKGRYSNVRSDQVLTFMALDPANPASILNCAKQAREGARAVRVSLTSEMWEVINSTWLELSKLSGKDLSANPQAFFDWVKERSHLFRGVSLGTMHRGDAFQFLRLGTFLERADNTARILDVKYHVLLSGPEEVGRAVDYYQWGSVLRSVSAFETYKRVYRDSITPLKIAELLMLRDDFPRSLQFCLREVVDILSKLSPTPRAEVLRLAGELDARLRFTRVQSIFKEGLHEYLTDFLSRAQALTDEIAQTFFRLDPDARSASNKQDQS
jgi:uncharacterized alpha-E superfamily protein